MKVKKLIVQVFLEIGKNEGFDKVTINKIVKECDISRTTFYYYFKDVPDVIDYYLGEEISSVSDVCVGLEDMKKGVEYCADKLIYNWLECKQLLDSKWRVPTEISLHNHWSTYVKKMISGNRKGIPIREETRSFLTKFMSGGICDFIVYGDHSEIDVQEFAEQFCLLLNARHKFS